jgi:hypothetical protein
MKRTSLLLLVLVIASCSSASAPSQGTCTGQCVQDPGTSRYVIWSGPQGATVPPCPDLANVDPVVGYFDTAPSKVTCSPCTCGPSSNTCSPSGTMHANSATCPATGTGVQHAPFDAPTNWDGACSSMDPVASADSVTVEPPALGAFGACTASSTGATEFTDGQTMTLSCHSVLTNSSDVAGACPDPTQVCTYPNVPGFAICIYVEDGSACPASWPVQHLIFEKPDACYCSCGVATGEGCSVKVTAYADGACMNPLGSVEATSDQPAACFDVAPGSALGSKEAALTYTAGTCTSSLQTLRVETVCCMP